MSEHALRKALLIAATLSGLLASAKGGHASDIMVMDQVARASAVATARTAAVYLSVMNHGAMSDTLVAITSEAAESVELHESTTVDGVMKMRPIENLELAPNATAKLEPGRLHIMLVGLKAPLVKGQTIMLEMTFKSAGVVSVAVPVGDVAAANISHAEHEMDDKSMLAKFWSWLRLNFHF